MSAVAARRKVSPIAWPGHGFALEVCSLSIYQLLACTQGCLKGQLVDSEGRPASARPDSSDQSNAELLDVLGTVTENELIVHALLLQGS